MAEAGREEEEGGDGGGGAPPRPTYPEALAAYEKGPQLPVEMAGLTDEFRVRLSRTLGHPSCATESAQATALNNCSMDTLLAAQAALGLDATPDEGGRDPVEVKLARRKRRTIMSILDCPLLTRWRMVLTVLNEPRAAPPAGDAAGGGITAEMLKIMGTAQGDALGRVLGELEGKKRERDEIKEATGRAAGAKNIFCEGFQLIFIITPFRFNFPNNACWNDKLSFVN